MVILILSIINLITNSFIYYMVKTIQKNMSISNRLSEGIPIPPPTK